MQMHTVLHALIDPTGTVAALQIQICHWINQIKTIYF